VIVDPPCGIVETGNDSWRFKRRTDDHATTRARPISPRRIRLGIAGIDLRGAAGAVVRWRRRRRRWWPQSNWGKRRSGAVCPTVVPAKAWRGRPVHLSPVRRLFVGRAGGSDAKCCSPSCRWKKANLIRWGGCRTQAAAAQRGPGGGRRCRECARHRHFRALGPFDCLPQSLPRTIYSSITI
jgi:hypothetical protein